MGNKILFLFCISIFFVAISSCTHDWGDIKVGQISNIYTQDQVSSIPNSEFNKLDIAQERIHQYNTYSYLRAGLLIAYLKAYPPGSTGSGNNNSDFNQILKDFVKSSQTDTDVATNPDMAYRNLLDDVSSNFEYRAITQLKYQYSYLTNRDYKILYIPIQVTIIPGATSYENYYAEVSFKLIFKNEFAKDIHLIDLFPSKIFDNRMDNYSSAILNALMLSTCVDLATPKGGGAAGINIQNINELNQAFNGIRRVPIIISFVDRNSDLYCSCKCCADMQNMSIKFGWNIYPEKMFTDNNKLEYMFNPNSYDFLAIIAVSKNLTDDKFRPYLESSYKWKILPQERSVYWHWMNYINPYVWGEVCTNSGVSPWASTNEYPDKEDYKIITEQYNPIDRIVPTITYAEKYDNNSIVLKGTDLDNISSIDYIYKPELFQILPNYITVVNVLPVFYINDETNTPKDIVYPQLSSNRICNPPYIPIKGIYPNLSDNTFRAPYTPIICPTLGCNVYWTPYAIRYWYYDNQTKSPKAKYCLIDRIPQSATSSNNAPLKTNSPDSSRIDISRDKVANINVNL